MAQEYDNTNRGALFKNHDKEEDNHPDYRGTINVKGTEFWLSAWLKESKKGEKFMSLSVKQKEQKPAPKGPARRPEGEDGDSIPF